MVYQTLSNTPNKNIEITWEQYEKDIRELVANIEKNGEQFACIYAIPRGGLVIGVHLSHILKLPLTQDPYGNVLVVDDISDTGETLLQWSSKSHASIATLYWKSGTKTLPDYTVRSYYPNEWIVFPWEK